MPLPRLCRECEYDLDGLVRPGHLVVSCPECGEANDFSKLNVELMHEDLPPWWVLVPRLAWPMGVYAFALAVVRYFWGVTPVSLLVLGLFVLIAGATRAVLIACDCSTPRQRARTIGLVVALATAGNAMIFVLVWSVAAGVVLVLQALKLV